MNQANGGARAAALSSYISHNGYYPYSPFNYPYYPYYSSSFTYLSWRSPSHLFQHMVVVEEAHTSMRCGGEKRIARCGVYLLEVLGRTSTRRRRGRRTAICGD